MAKLVFIPDLHGRTYIADEIFRWEADADRFIHSNDCFDWFFDSPEENGVVAKWLGQQLKDPRQVFLMANHIQSYTWPYNVEMYCSGFTKEKAKAIYKNISKGELLKCKLAHIEEGIVFSHAGFDDYLFKLLAQKGYDHPDTLTPESIKQWIDLVTPKLYADLDDNKCHPLLMAGDNREGRQLVGGVTWQDFHSFKPIPNIRQIVGHTIVDAPLFRFIGDDKLPPWGKIIDGRSRINPKSLTKGWGLCLDTNSHHYAVIGDNVLSIHTVKYTWNRQTKSIERDSLSRGEKIFSITYK